MKKFRVGVIGGTGMVGQRLLSLLVDHPWFEVTAIAASANSAGKRYEDAIKGRQLVKFDIPDAIKNIIVSDAEDVAGVSSKVDFVFCAVNMKKDEIKKLEEAYAKAECPVVSNNSAHRGTPDVPMIIPEINASHADIIPYQRKRLGTRRGFIAVKSNCSIQSYVPAISALMDLNPTKIAVCTMQAISGAGKNFDTWPEMLDNVMPYIAGEEEKSEIEPMKVWGKIENGIIAPAVTPSITAQCLRVPVTDGHMAAVFASFDKKASVEEIIEKWNNYKGAEIARDLPHSPDKFITYFDDPSRPQTRLDRDLYNGMGISVGRLRPDTQYDVKFVCLSHNTLRGAAGGGVLMAELLCKMGYMD